jgi:dihydroflavonol-4-reductase
MNGKNVLVTGANGHVGYALTKLLVERGYNVRASVRNKNDKEKILPLSKLDIDIVELDLMETEAIDSAMDGMDGLFQVAAVYKSWAKDPEEEIINPSIIGGINALESANRAGVQKVVFTSSTAAIGRSGPNGRALTEDDWNSTSKHPYSYAKTEAEKRAWDYAKNVGMNLVVINPTAVIGPYFHRHTPSTMLFDKLLKGELKALPPQTFGYVDVRDVALGHLKAYENNHAEGRHILCTSCLDGFELMSIIQELEPELKLPKKIVPMWKMKLFARLEITRAMFGHTPRISPETVKEYMNKITNYDANKAKGTLGWNPMELKDSIRDTLSWIKHNLS